jgi:hypothetical protein
MDRGLEKYRVDEEDTVSKQRYFSQVLQGRSAVISMMWSDTNETKNHLWWQQ